MLEPQILAQLIEQKKVLAIMGPTASGKSRLSMALAEVLPIEIISVDSALIYRDMDIGTAKPTAAELDKVPHHLIDILSPSQTYSASEFVADTHRLVAEIFARGRLPVLVGGTMMYFHALQQGMAQLPEANEAIRSRLMVEWFEDAAAVYAQLQAVDPQICQRIHANDQQRIMRALEVYEITGKPLSVLQQEGQGQGLSAFDLVKVVLLPESRAELHHQIKLRFMQMLDHGLLSEVETLMTNPELHPDLPSIRSVGYRQAWSYLMGEMNEETFIEQGISATRQLAKRQITWLRKEQTALSLDSFELSKEALLSQTLNYFTQSLLENPKSV
ncbi:tRNA (adenosine(37)-N6)-dimethylallyltransferase MiaA [Thiosulfativibrio zosterae]|uniref:tRNA dimethylallyltransferase n=1 Tax=Thiosulfativibrio zosterae TaxID=2675053 RepID=A0A6F8PPB9_9GAMM|nr:tRNA (adenosine(37)-N6)-dimethylallyltransferase MiaA [Thiosulfativibrio zosterae]BBP43840.1 tRNA dimethylallyltransferase [Thiosulfativibrio zosterae]